MAFPSRAGVAYVVALCEISPPPLTQSAANVKPPAALPTALALAGKLKQYSWGSVLGLTATGAAGVLAEYFREQPWLDIPLGLGCIGAGILFERAVHYSIGRDIDSKLELAAARRDADRRLENLRDFQRKGIISGPEAHKLAFGIAKRSVIGPPKAGKTRGPYRKRQKLPDQPPDAFVPPDHPGPQLPTA